MTHLPKNKTNWQDQLDDISEQQSHCVEAHQQRREEFFALGQLSSSHQWWIFLFESSLLDSFSRWGWLNFLKYHQMSQAYHIVNSFQKWMIQWLSNPSNECLAINQSVSAKVCNHKHSSCICSQWKIAHQKYPRVSLRQYWRTIIDRFPRTIKDVS